MRVCRSVRSRRHRVHRRMVRQALADAVPPVRKTPERMAPALGRTGYGARLAGRGSDAPRKQRHTARRVWQRLMDEQGAVVAESTVRALVAELKARRAERRR